MVKTGPQDGCLVFGACVTWALVATSRALRDRVRHRAYGRTAGIAAVAVLIGVGAVVTDWPPSTRRRRRRLRDRKYDGRRSGS